MIGAPHEDTEDESSDDSPDEAEEEHIPITHYFFQLRCIPYRRPSQLNDPNDPDGPKIRTETDQDRMVRDNLVALLRSYGAKSVSSASLEFSYDLGTRKFPPTKQVNALPSPMLNATDLL